MAAEGDRLFTPRRVVSALLLMAAAAGAVYAFTSSPTEREQRCVATSIERVSPCEGDLDLRQGEIMVDLATGFTGVLLIDRTEIPEDQLRRIDPLNQFFFTPTAESETGLLRPGHHCATTIFWPIGQTREESGKAFTWCFDVH